MALRSSLFAVTVALLVASPAALAGPPKPQRDRGAASIGGPATAENPFNVVGLTKEVVDNLRTIAKRDPARNAQVFMKIGDSITSGGGSDGALGCFAAAEKQVIDLAGRDELKPTIAYFDQVKMASGGRSANKVATSSWNRDSFAAVVSVDSSWPMRPNDAYDKATAIDKELSDLRGTPPRFAIYMLGSNDIGSSPGLRHGHAGDVLKYFADKVLAAVELLSSRGIIPVLTYIPPIPGRSEQSLWYSPAAAAVLRGIATAKRLPSIDAYSEMEDLGIAASKTFKSGKPQPGPGYWDDIHTAAPPRAECSFTAPHLQYGRNLRGLRTLEVLDKLRRVFADNVAFVDPPPPAIAGKGTVRAPFEVPTVPFAYATPTSGPEAGHLKDYTSCGGLDTPLDGDETVFRLDIASEISLRALAIPGDCPDSTCSKGQEMAVALFKNSVEPKNCVSAGIMVQRKFSPGTYYLVLDSPRSRQPKTGVLSVHRCMEPDEDCAKCSATDAACVSPP